MMRIKALGEPEEKEGKESYEPNAPTLFMPPSTSPEAAKKPTKKQVFYKSGKATAVGICKSRVTLYLYIYLAALVVEGIFIFLFIRDMRTGWGYIATIFAIGPLAAAREILDLESQLEAEIESFAVYQEGQPQYQPLDVDEDDIEVYSNSSLTKFSVLFLIGLQWVLYVCVYTGKKDTAGTRAERTIGTFVVIVSSVLFLIFIFIRDLDDIIKERKDLPFPKRFYFPILYGITSK